MIATQIIDVRTWLGKGGRLAGVGYLDQLLSGIRQFATLWIASRFLSVKDFADFAVLTAAALYGMQCANYLIRLPALVYSGGALHDRVETYLSYLKKLDVVSSVLVASLLLVVLEIFQVPISIPVALLFMSTCVALNVLELERRSRYIEAKPIDAAIMSGTALAGTIVLLFVMAYFRVLNTASALASLSVGALVPALTSQIMRPAVPGSTPTIRRIAQLHARYAGWELLGGTFLWMATQGIVVGLRPVFSSEQVGAFRLLTSLSGLVTFPIIVAENTLTTRAAEALRNAGILGLRTFVEEVNSRLLLPGVFYIAASALACWIFVLLFIRDRFPSAQSMLVSFLVYVTFSVAAATGNIALRASVQTRWICVAEASRFVIAAATILIAVRLGSAIGAAAALGTGAVAVLAVQRLALRNVWAQEAKCAT